MSDNFKSWNKNNNLIEDLIKTKEKIKEKILKNSGIAPIPPYITGLVNYKEIKQILKECKCEYTKRYDSMNNLFIENIQDKYNLLLENYKNLYCILQLHGSILFVERVNFNED